MTRRGLPEGYRISAELGADLVNVPYTSNGGDFSKVVSGCPVPILVSGGEADDTIINTITKAISAGVCGVAIGRNIFQSDNIHEKIKEIISVVRHETR